MVLEKDNKIKSCYIHIPFCKNICSYCDFCKNFYDEKIVSDYLNALTREIDDNYNKEILDTIYIGGGTPSSLSFNNLEKLLEILKKIKLSKTYEFTFECNYDDITEELLILLKQNRVNRISIGVQTFNEKYEKILNRKINKKEMLYSINLSKKYFDNVNIDLMYALPEENIETLEEDLITFIDLDVEHISTYALIVEEHTKLGLSNLKEVDEDTQNNMYYKIVNKLKDNGYIHYELSNFSRPGYESKHNLTYWKNEEYYGFGAGASGFVDNVRYDNTKSVINYINGKTHVYEEKLSIDQKIKDEVMLNLRMIKGIDKEDFKNKYNIYFDKVFNYKSLISNGYLIEDNKSIYIPEDKLFVSNEIIIMLLDCYTLNK